MSKMNSRETSGFFAGIVIGAMIGVAMGFLFAPKSGEETRKAYEVKDKAVELTDKVRHVAEDVQAKLQP
jgi:gas vesicle protein